jgi:hypothetical protein
MKCGQLGVLGLGLALLSFTFMEPRPATGQSYRAASQQPYIGQGGWNDPDMGKLHAEEAKFEGQVHELMARYAKTEDDKEHTKIKTDLAKVLADQFESQQKRRAAEVAAIEKQLKKLKDLIEKRKEARQKIIDKRLDQLLSEAEGLGWTSPHGGGWSNFYRQGTSEDFAPSLITIGDEKPAPESRPR